MDRVNRLRLLYLLHLRKKRRRRGSDSSSSKGTGGRKLWIRPLLAERSKVGAFKTLFEDLRKDGDEFFTYFGMSIETFDELHEKIQHYLLRQDTNMRASIKPVERLAVTLR